jgi:hypothetical protein
VTRKEFVSLQSQATPGTNDDYTSSMSLQERDFSNPIYCKDTVADAQVDSEEFYAAIASTEEIYTVPDSPPCNIYDTVADYRSENVATDETSGDNTYSVI